MTNIIFWLDDKGIAKIIAPGTRRVEVDQFAETLRAVFSEWQADQPYLLLFDLSNVGVTPYSTKVARDLATETPKFLKGRLALLIPDGFFATVATNALMTIMRPVQDNLEFRFFKAAAEDAALDWLREYLRMSLREGFVE
jgi:hypothetical protein